MMIKVVYTEMVRKELVAEIDADGFFAWSGGQALTSHLLAEYLDAGAEGWQEELQGLTGHRVAQGGEILEVQTW